MKVGVVDTTFSLIDMGKIIVTELREFSQDVDIVRRTVPGIKDLPVASKILLKDCDICIAAGMPGPMEKDKVCAHEASNGLIQAALMCDKHIVEVFVHEDEGETKSQLSDIVEDRCKKHARNAVMLIKHPKWFIKNAGTGLRQGGKNKGSINH